jgi:hypothetical protein
MVNYSCEKCSFKTNQKNDYTRHLNKKRPCNASTINNVENTTTTSIVDNSYNVINITQPETNNNVVLIRIENERLKMENEMLKKEILELKIERKEIFNLLKSQASVVTPPPPPPPIGIVQPPPPQIIQIVQEEQPKEINRKLKSEFCKDKFNDCIIINDFIDNLDYSPEDIVTMVNAEGGDNEKRFINGLSNVFLKYVNKFPNVNDRPIFCSDKSNKTLHFKYRNDTPKKKLMPFTEKELWKKYPEELCSGDISPCDFKQDDYGRFLVEVEYTDNSVEWVKETNNHPIFMTMLQKFRHNITRNLICKEKKKSNDDYLSVVNDLNSCEYIKFVKNSADNVSASDEYITANTICNGSIVELGASIISRICKGVYVGAE